MAYEPTVWETGDIVTAEKLNKIEGGIVNAGGLFIVHADSNGVLDKTYAEIVSAAEKSRVIWAEIGDELTYLHPLFGYGYANGEYQLTFNYTAPNMSLFTAQTEDGYPSTSFD